MSYYYDITDIIIELNEEIQLLKAKLYSSKISYSDSEITDLQQKEQEFTDKLKGLNALVEKGTMYITYHSLLQRGIPDFGVKEIYERDVEKALR